MSSCNDSLPYIHCSDAVGMIVDRILVFLLIVLLVPLGRRGVVTQTDP